jgi:hypothetical protein
VLKPKARHRHRWGDNIKMDLEEIAWDGVDHMYVACDRASGRLL